MEQFQSRGYALAQPKKPQPVMQNQWKITTSLWVSQWIITTTQQIIKKAQSSRTKVAENSHRGITTSTITTTKTCRKKQWLKYPSSNSECNLSKLTITVLICNTKCLCYRRCHKWHWCRQLRTTNKWQDQLECPITQLISSSTHPNHTLCCPSKDMVGSSPWWTQVTPPTSSSTSCSKW